LARARKQKGGGAVGNFVFISAKWTQLKSTGVKWSGVYWRFAAIISKTIVWLHCLAKAQLGQVLKLLSYD